MTDLKGLIKAQIMDTVVKGVQTESGWKVLIVDADALKMISACCRMFDLTDNGVTIVEDLAKKRMPMRDLDAVYLCAPNSANARLIRDDFTPKAKYKAAHIFFIDAAEDAVISELAHPALKASLRCMTELNMNFVPTESAVFTLDMPNGLHEYYSPQSRNNRANVVAAKIASVCAALGEIPVVRFTAGSRVCEGLARQVQDRIDQLAQYDDGMRRKKSQVLIVDRGEDLAAPLVHELSYQCAVYDLLGKKLDGDIYTHTFQDGAGNTRTKRVVLGDNDEVWDEMRHMHIAEVGENVAKRFKEFQAASEAVVGGDTSTPEGKQKALKAMMQAAPQRKEKTDKFSLHLSLAAAITSGAPPEPAAFGKLAESCVQAEQNILTGVDGEGKKVKSLVGELGAFIGERGPTQAKLRALGVCVVAAGGLPDAELNRLYDLADIGFKDRKAVKNMGLLGAPVALKPREKPRKPRSRMDTGNPALTQYFTSRWTPVVKDFMVGAVTGSLSTRDYPAVKGSPAAMVDAGSTGEEIVSARKAGRRNWAKNRAKADEDPAAAAAAAGKDRNRLIIFVPGAIGYNEMRCAYEVGKQYDLDVYIGSHTVAAPDAFLARLQDLDEAMVPEGAGIGGVADALEATERIQVVQGRSTGRAGPAAVPGQVPSPETLSPTMI